jgi:hypothetical protein
LPPEGQCTAPARQTPSALPRDILPQLVYLLGLSVILDTLLLVVVVV